MPTYHFIQLVALHALPVAAVRRRHQACKQQQQPQLTAKYNIL